MSDPLWSDVALLFRFGNDTLDDKGNTRTLNNITGDPGVEGLSDNETKWSPDYSYSSYIAPSNAYISVSGAALTAVNFGQGDFSVDVWIRGRSFTTPGAAIFTTDIAASDPGFILEHVDNFDVRYRLNDGTTTLTSSNISIGQNNWVFLTIERVGSSVRAYVNGEFDGAAETFSGNLVVSGGATVGIGGDGTTNGHRAYMNDLRVTANQRYNNSEFDTSLPTGPAPGAGATPITAIAQLPSPISGVRDDPDEIILDATNPPELLLETAPLAQIQIPAAIGAPAFQAIVDPVVVDPDFASVVTLQHFDGSFNQTASQVVLSQVGGLTTQATVFKFGGGAVQVSGTGQYQEGTGFDFASDFTMECFINVSTLGINNVYLFDNRADASDTNGMVLRILSSGLMRFQFFLGASGIVLDADTAVTASTWHHVALVRSGTTVRMFLDGTQVATTTQAFQITNTTGRFFQAYTGVEFNAQAYVDELRVTQLARYTSDFTPALVAFPDSDTLTTSVTAQIEIGSPVGAPTVVGEFFVAQLEIPSPVGAPQALLVNDFTSLLDDVVERYELLLIDAIPQVRIPISSWQGTLQVDREDYVQAVVPGYDDYAGDLAFAQTNGHEFEVIRYSFINGQRVNQLLARAPVQTVQVNEGPFRSTATISGYKAANHSSTSITPVGLTGVRSFATTVGGAARFRSDIDWFLRPGQQVSHGARTITADYISYFVTTAGDSYMDVGSRG